MVAVWQDETKKGGGSVEVKSPFECTIGTSFSSKSTFLVMKAKEYNVSCV